MTVATELPFHVPSRLRGSTIVTENIDQKSSQKKIDEVNDGIGGNRLTNDVYILVIHFGKLNLEIFLFNTTFLIMCSLSTFW